MPSPQRRFQISAAALLLLSAGHTVRTVYCHIFNIYIPVDILLFFMQMDY